jgi:hypothetical protein
VIDTKNLKVVNTIKTGEGSRAFGGFIVEWVWNQCKSLS